MKCSVFLAQIRGEGGRLAAPCPRRRWLKMRSREEGGQHPTTRWQGAEESAAGDASTTVPAGHRPSARGAVSHLEERIPPPLPLQGCFAYAPLGRERSFIVAVQKS